MFRMPTTGTLLASCASATSGAASKGRAPKKAHRSITDVMRTVARCC